MLLTVLRTRLAAGEAGHVRGMPARSMAGKRLLAREVAAATSAAVAPGQ